jgi:hypothetical protein
VNPYGPFDPTGTRRVPPDGMRIVYLFPQQPKGLTARVTDLANPRLQEILTLFTLQFGPATLLQDRRTQPRIWDAT